jgi:ABC-2 type transport system permease protein
MFAPFTAELIKLRRSLALLLCAAAPIMVALLGAMILLDHDGPSDWRSYARTLAGLWAFFMLPMAVTALTVLVAQLEHGPRFWNHLLALPVPRWRLYAAKAATVMLLVAGMSGTLWLLIPLSGWLVEALKPGVQLSGAWDAAGSAALLAKMAAGAVLLVAIQLWVALRFRSFVPPLVIGIGGTFVAVAATRSKLGACFPWLLPANALAAEPGRAAFAIGIGLWGGLALLALMLRAMSRREAPGA